MTKKAKINENILKCNLLNGKGLLFMETIEEKISTLTKLMQDGILTAEEFAAAVAAINAGANASQIKEKSELEKQYDYVFQNHIINAFKSPSACKWPELTSDMIKKGEIKIVGKATPCTYIETYIDAPNSYGTMLRKGLRLVIDDNGKIIRALQPLQTTGFTLLGTVANAINKYSWYDIVTL